MATGSQPFISKQQSIRRWVRRRLGGDVAHERRVAEIATNLFDLTREFHPLGAADRRLLALAALVHDVGRSIDADGHEKHGAAMLLADDSLPITPAQRRALAYLTRHHRGGVPALTDDEILTVHDPRESLRTTLALLRAADALDGRSVQRPRLVFTLGRGGATPELRVTCYLDEESAKARKVYGRRKKFRLLEELLGVRVVVDVRLAEALSMVA
jgi:exopolyphosphatase/guanosine-5'-triphosphate,3'-diphosphate pyrophosphatase